MHYWAIMKHQISAGSKTKTVLCYIRFAAKEFSNTAVHGIRLLARIIAALIREEKWMRNATAHTTIEKLAQEFIDDKINQGYN